MRRATAWAALAVSAAGFLLFFWISREGDAAEGAFRMGRPDAWMSYEWRPDGFHSQANFLRWSAGAGVLGVYCLQYAVRQFRRKDAKTAHTPTS